MSDASRVTELIGSIITVRLQTKIYRSQVVVSDINSRRTSIQLDIRHEKNYNGTVLLTFA